MSQVVCVLWHSGVLLKGQGLGKWTSCEDDFGHLWQSRECFLMKKLSSTHLWEPVALLLKMLMKPLNTPCTKRLTDQLSDRLSDQLTDQISEWLTDQLSYRLTDQLSGQMTDQLSNQLTDRLLMDWLTYRWTYEQMNRWLYDWPGWMDGQRWIDQ